MADDYALCVLNLAEWTMESYLENFSNTLMLCYSQHVSPQLQNGPECGIVALSMATELFSETAVDKKLVLETAQQNGFSIKGEMFSCENMAALAEAISPLQAVVLSDLETQKHVLIDHVLSGYPVLIPYDSDRNNYPCCRKGHSAHWALITGISIVIKKTDFYKSNQSASTSSVPNVYICDRSFVSTCLHKSLLTSVFALQSKSRKLAMWELSHLLESNFNLREVSDLYLKCEMVIPENDPLSGLRNKAVLLFPVNKNYTIEPLIFQSKVYVQLGKPYVSIFENGVMTKLQNSLQEIRQLTGATVIIKIIPSFHRCLDKKDLTIILSHSDQDAFQKAILFAIKSLEKVLK